MQTMRERLSSKYSLRHKWLPEKLKRICARKSEKNIGKPKLEMYYEHTDRINRDGKAEVWMKDYWSRSISLWIQIVQV